MLNKSFNIFKNIVIAFAVTMFFSCKNNFKEVGKIGLSENEPIGVADNINLKYTDSGRVVANLISSKMYDYSNRSFSFNEFTNGVILHLYDEKNKRNTIISDYAIIYDKTNLIDLRGNVIVSTPTKDTLFADQLFYDQNNEWIFTNLPVKFKSTDYVTHGNGFDSDKAFTKAQVLEINGLFAVKE